MSFRPQLQFQQMRPQMFVVERLPVPMHVSDGPVGRNIGWGSGGEPRHEAATYGELYSSHPYWRSKVAIAPLAYGPTQGYVDQIGAPNVWFSESLRALAIFVAGAVFMKMMS